MIVRAVCVADTPSLVLVLRSAGFSMRSKVP